MQHLYVIERTFDGTTEVVKVGISGGRIRKDGKSSRAESQVRKWNEEEEGSFRSRIVEKNICGRAKALTKEEALALRLKAKGLLFEKKKNEKLFHTRP